MTSLAVIQIEGVLAQVHTDLAPAKPIDDAIFMFEGMRRHWKLAIVTAATHERGVAERWLKTYNFAGYDLLDCMPTAIADPPEVWLSDRTIANYRAMGWEVGPYMSANPVVIARALQLGVSGMLLTNPLYMRPEHRPDAERSPRAWGTLVEEIETQQELKANDRRLEAEDVIGGFERPDG